jgi:hypothetical protein
LKKQHPKKRITPKQHPNRKNGKNKNLANGVSTLFTRCFKWCGKRDLNTRKHFLPLFVSSIIGVFLLVKCPILRRLKMFYLSLSFGNF